MMQHKLMKDETAVFISYYTLRSSSKLTLSTTDPRTHVALDTCRCTDYCV